MLQKPPRITAVKLAMVSLDPKHAVVSHLDIDACASPAAQHNDGLPIGN